MNALSAEPLIFSLVLGVCLGALFALLELLRILLELGRIVTFVTDTAFTLLCAVATFILAIAVSHGRLRFYQLGCEVIGFVCVYSTVVQLVRLHASRLMRCIRRHGRRARKSGERTAASGKTKKTRKVFFKDRKKIKKKT